MNGNGVPALVTCPTCRHSIPAGNERVHEARCQRRTPPPVVQQATPSKKEEEEMIDLTSPEGQLEEERGASKDSSSSMTMANAPPPAAATTASWSSDGGSTGSNSTTTSRHGQPKDDGAEDGGNKRGGDDDISNDDDDDDDGDDDDDNDIQIKCSVCTFDNPGGADMCQMCGCPLGGCRGGDGLNAMQQGDEDDEVSTQNRWSCPMCTFSGNRRGQWVCQACEVGRPRREDMLDYENPDGFVMVSPAGGMGGRRRRRRPGGAASATMSMNNPMRALEDMITGALVGGGIAGMGSALVGGTGTDTRRRMLQGMLMGGLGGGLMGAQVREMMALDQDIDNMSYEDMLNLFGPGNEPEKASAAAVAALPETTVSEADLARMRRQSTGDARDCSVCMEEYGAGDVTRRLPCTHSFHKECIDKWLLQCNASCPICKVPCGQP